MFMDTLIRDISSSNHSYGVATRHLNPSLAVLSFISTVDCPADVCLVLLSQVGSNRAGTGCSCLAWQLHPPVPESKVLLRELKPALKVGLKWG